MAAAARVLDTVELLEMIILDLPIRDVFSKQRVSRRWRSTVAESIQLQQALFLKPIPSEQSEILPGVTTFALDTSCAEVLATPGRKTIFQSVLSISEDEFGVLSNINEVADASNYQNNFNVHARLEEEDQKDLELLDVTTLAGGALQKKDLDLFQVVTLEGSPHVGIINLCRAISKHVQDYDSALYKSRKFKMTGGCERQMKVARACFLAQLASSSYRRLRGRRGSSELRNMLASIQRGISGIHG
ncbi:hypothetical protein M409DRAFT_16408 [Zasmidium cellare ATCC 36951]|uniref:F-box domain-containing protein n=1 Tax=Zasmidium cellare ATCC 36951 TaxID=1080233 RepID=A0A6A6D6S9_ZASCE|nr:uncharacterized protein M409DRAFT_16408 [Zasmidium cellare ATCC 36951]KAF2174138.1 hypothetical protein M409DRAFT_16408 [Zasmidium cellare ATCC 36951]